MIVTILFANVFIGIVLEVLSAVASSKKVLLSVRDIEMLIIDADQEEDTSYFQHTQPPAKSSQASDASQDHKENI
jgi:uncharacterized protein YccT (UPF0319 family)